MPKLAAFPKAFMNALCKDGSMTIHEWIDLAKDLEIDGLEWYAGFLEMKDESRWDEFRSRVESYGLVIPMMCCSPDFTHPDESFRAQEIAKQKYWIKMSHRLGSKYCRVLSGQRRPNVSIDEGLKYAIDSIEACIPFADEHDVTLILENHYKDDFWEFPEFAQKMEIFTRLVAGIRSDRFGVNFDPSNTYLAGEDPMDLLRLVSDRVVTMHASDRYLKEGTLEDLRKEEGGPVGYAKRLSHGEIGKGLNDYDAIFTELKRVGFDGWISIEDGVEGMEQLKRSVAFLKNKISRYWPNAAPL